MYTNIEKLIVWFIWGNMWFDDTSILDKKSAVEVIHLLKLEIGRGRFGILVGNEE